MSDNEIHSIHGEWEPSPIVKRMFAYKYAHMMKALHHMQHIARQLRKEGGI